MKQEQKPYFSPELSEQEIVSKIIASRELYSAFDVFIVPYYLHPRDDISEAWIFTNIPSGALGFSEGRPGDIDLLYVPLFEGRPQPGNCVCAEIKIIRPTRANPGKDHKDSGREQIVGLLQRRVPVISLNHIILPDTNRVLHQISETEDAMESMREIGPYLSGINNERQEGRLKSLALPECVGYGAALIEEVGHFLMSTVNHGRFCTHNPEYDGSFDSHLMNFLEKRPKPEIVLPARPGHGKSWV